ncbi:hypothetical protein C8A03DRAFT_44525 [Achaetomium macrosporum]|uniref:Uncharacterized protein n=1 Tax=Achaetomium macrosporum TaxID=79813 RepID=A0AAN7C9U4_9PEZI|nr:hypothetical protein C8A03DRAFT_44525 [Achaetomium macrosporum]
METHTSQSSGSASTQQVGDPYAAFKRFDSYPWARDRSFLQGLMATLGPTLLNKSNDGFMRQKALGTTLQARIWWYKSRFDLDIDRISYEAYSTSHPSTSPDGAILAKLEEIQQRMGLGASSSSSTTGQTQTQNIPAWQLNAPKVDLSKKADDRASHTGDGAPYPSDFEALVEAITTGKPVPNTKKIPDTIIRPPGITPFGKMKTPRKPWEKDAPSDIAAQPSIFGNVVDKEFPPLSGDSNGGSGQGSHSSAT